MAQILPHFNLTNLNTLGLKSQAEFYTELQSLEDFHQLKSDNSTKNMKWSILGGGSNLVLPSEVSGLVIKMAHLGKFLQGEDSENFYVTVNAGENWHEFVQWTLAHGFFGLENLSLIPGTAGAAPIQNIGAYGLEVKDLIHEVQCLDIKTGETKTFSNSDCHFSYRESFFKQEGQGLYLVWSVTYRLPKKNKLRLEYGDLRKELSRLSLSENARHIAEAVISLRQSKLPDPQVIGNAGSFFKNPIISPEQRASLLQNFPDLVSYPFGDEFKLAAGWLIDRAGWKGKDLGPVGMYEKQALVLVNRGQAESSDVWALANQVIADVQNKFGVTLDPEPIRW